MVVVIFNFIAYNLTIEQLSLITTNLMNQQIYN